MSDWTEGRTWTRVVRRDTRDESGWITVEQAAPGAPFLWAVTLVGAPGAVRGVASSLRYAKRDSQAAYTNAAFRLVRARGGV